MTLINLLVLEKYHLIMLVSMGKTVVLYVSLMQKQVGFLALLSNSTDNLGKKEEVQQRSKSANEYGGTTQVVSTRDW
jgi:hypothetical protein